MKKTAAIYTRVAVEDQKNDTALKELGQYCKRMDWDIIEYKEKPSLVKVRPLLDLLMHDARQEKFEVVVVWKLDRFAQSTSQRLQAIFGFNIQDGGCQWDVIFRSEADFRLRSTRPSRCP